MGSSCTCTLSIPWQWMRSIHALPLYRQGGAPTMFFRAPHQVLPHEAELQVMRGSGSSSRLGHPCMQCCCQHLWFPSHRTTLDSACFCLWLPAQSLGFYFHGRQGVHQQHHGFEVGVRSGFPKPQVVPGDRFQWRPLCAQYGRVCEFHLCLGARSCPNLGHHYII